MPVSGITNVRDVKHYCAQRMEIVACIALMALLSAHPYSKIHHVVKRGRREEVFLFALWFTTHFMYFMV